MASVALLKKKNDKHTNALKKAKGDAEIKAKEKEHQRLVLHAEALKKKSAKSKHLELSMLIGNRQGTRPSLFMMAMVHFQISRRTHT
jgi:hypothetical protein